MSIALLDFSGAFWVAFHGSGGDGGFAKARTLETIRNLRHRFDVVVACVDSPKSWRRELYPEYKAGREKPAGAVELLVACQEEAANLCHVVGAEGFEADDVIATLAEVNITGGGEDVTVVSSDKDMAQCIRSEAVAMEKLDGKPFDPVEKWGVKPEQVPCFLALCGDKSDNIPGVPSVGPKTAAKLLDRFGGLEGIAAGLASGEVGEVVGPAATDKLAMAFDAPEDETPLHWRHLVTLRTDAPIDASVLTQPTTPEEDDMTDEQQTPPPEDSQPESDERPAKVHEGVVERDSSPGDDDAPRALATYDVAYPQALEPRTPKMAWLYAEKLFRSGMFKVRNPESAFAILIAGRAYGLGAVESLMGIHLIEGKPALSSGLIQALVQRSPDCDYFEIAEQTSERVTCRCKRSGRPEQSLTWTLDDADKAGLLKKDVWRKYPRAMLRARCVTELARTAFADVVHNVYTPEELGAAIDSPEAA